MRYRKFGLSPCNEQPHKLHFMRPRQYTRVPKEMVGPCGLEPRTSTVSIVWSES
jgi:hypothetical protein